jgi:hypothetical protein
MFLELLQVLVEQPSQYSSMLSEIMGTMFNMNHLVNMARPLQVKRIAGRADCKGIATTCSTQRFRWGHCMCAAGLRSRAGGQLCVWLY